MNKNGKGGTIFIVLIPLILIVTLIIVDTIVSFTTNKNYERVTEEILTDIMNNNEINIEDYNEEIKHAYERKGYETDMLVVEANSYDVYIENEHEYFNLFSSLSKKHGDEGEIKILGVTFKVKKNSVARLKVTASYDYEGNIVFEYTR